MTKEEIEQLKADIKAEVIKELTGKDAVIPVSEKGLYNRVRNKYKDKLYQVYGVYHYAQVWDHIRRLSCYMAGVKYIRELTPSSEIVAADYAEKLCIMALESRGVDISE